MVACSHYNHVVRQIVNLQQQGADDALYFTCFVRITALFTQRFELVEEKHATLCASKVDEILEAACGLSQIAADRGFVSHNK